MTVEPLLQFDHSLRQHNTFGIDVRAHAYLPIFSVADLCSAAQNPTLASLPRLILGGGSNILLQADFPGLVLHMCNRGIECTGEDERAMVVRAAAGESWHQLVLWTLSQGWGGLENLSLIPGSVGAAPIQNIGAYGAELQDCFHSLTAFDMQTGEIFTLDKAACQFAYRDSVFKHALRDRAVILDVSFALPKHWQANLRYAELRQAVEQQGLQSPTPQEISAAVIAIRSRKLPDPAVIGNAGSFFKNPVIAAAQHAQLLVMFPNLVSYPQNDGSFKLAAGWLIDQCGWKGKTLGRAGVYPKQALVLTNLGGASGAEIAQLAAAIQADVEQRFAVKLEPEPLYIA
ncbi:MAG: UDP-N-acetylmuramate dehydrogenase [Pseudomonadota bacterium]